MAKRFFNREDVKLLKERQSLKRKLKKLDEHLLPLIQVACDELGDHSEVRVGSDTIHLSRVEGTNTSWKSVCESGMEPDVLIEMKSLFTVERITRKAVVK